VIDGITHLPPLEAMLIIDRAINPKRQTFEPPECANDQEGAESEEYRFRLV
jgi:hypothetical protein